jgi:hypothetical protein
MQGVVEAGRHCDQLGGGGAVKVGAAKAGGALEGAILVEHYAWRDQCDPGQEIGQTCGMPTIFAQTHHGRIQVG